MRVAVTTGSAASYFPQVLISLIGPKRRALKGAILDLERQVPSQGGLYVISSCKKYY